MKIKINEARKLSIGILVNFGFTSEDSKLITENLIDGELTGRKSHGLIRLPAIKRNIEREKISTTHKDVKVIKETNTSLLIDAKNKPGFIAIYKSLDKAILKVKKSGVVTVGICEAAYCSGYIGSYARKAALKNIIFVGFNNSPGGLVPHGSKKELWGTNPTTVGIPTKNIPVILDMASSKITWGDLLVARQEGKKIEKGMAIDKDGKSTTNSEIAMKGGLLPFFGHKGSGLAFIIELLAGALTGSRVGHSVPGGWGTFYILINPAIFRPLKDFKRDVQTAIDELKSAPKAEGFKEIYYLGERSARLRKENLEKGFVDIDEQLWKSLTNLLEK